MSRIFAAVVWALALALQGNATASTVRSTIIRMDGRGSLRGEKIRGWSREAWQAIALFALAGFVLSNAAWFYTYRTARVELASVELEHERNVSLEIIAPEPDPVQKNLSMDAVPTVVDDRGVKCISGQRFKKIVGGWEQLEGNC